jgi:cellulase/cellobiase CelA1
MVAMIAAGVLPVLGALGYLIFRAQAPSHEHALESEVQAYEKWVNQFAAGLGNRPAVVILEPDALAQLNSCLDTAEQHARLQMLSYAVKTLQTYSDQVYLDAGHSNWVPAGQMAARLRAADVAQAYGFALNVANYGTTGREIGYATELNRYLGPAKQFVVDTSRNGKGGAGGPAHPASGSISGALPGAGSISRALPGASSISRALPGAGSISQAVPGAGGGALENQLFIDPDTQAADWVRDHPGDPRAQEIGQRVANQPTAHWFGQWNGDITAAVSGYTIAASREHKVPVLVAYHIPHLNCGSRSSRGAKPWCNSPGRQLGSAPQVLDNRGDMGLWIKAPGESDGNCGAGAGTQPGQFSPRLATDLITGRS